MRLVLGQPFSHPNHSQEMLFMRTKLLFLGVVALSPLLQGCFGSSQDSVFPVTGKVTYQGNPIESGTIVLDSVDGNTTAAMGEIVNGEIKAEAPAGEKIIRISAVRTKNEKDQYGELITESYIPAKYNGQSDIKRTVSPDEANVFELTLE
ncbi:hypothetical protein [Blastopirellula marina]|uniref:Carboxypeptidase regulatory-like domain-containing protein n=2 Tax=Blastopirellula marina TaxID=124 RepID=A0A2S8FT66_9BACT|nr:hypothetical protein [Blastopirellula marina]PQO35365.1 hypothetical protein C5Y98_13440 [Blastopirellula marina]PTL44005.1 hypothetical protein C5Y97_13450 [Blastopirellula marina]